MPNPLDRYFPVLVNMAVVVLLLVIWQLRCQFGFRGERGKLLLTVPLPAGRKARLALCAAALAAALLYAAARAIAAYGRMENAPYALFLCGAFLLALALLQTLFSLLPVRLYENGMGDHTGFIGWNRLSYGGEEEGRFRLQASGRDLSRSSRLSKSVSLFCAAGQSGAVRDVLRGRAGGLN